MCESREAIGLYFRLGYKRVVPGTQPDDARVRHVPTSKIVSRQSYLTVARRTAGSSRRVKFVQSSTKGRQLRGMAQEGTPMHLELNLYMHGSFYSA